MKVIAVGDIHAKTSNLDVIVKLFEELKALVVKERPQYVVLLGDLLNDHSRMHIQSTAVIFQCVRDLAKACVDFGEVAVLVGNHDMMNNTEIFPERHALEGLRSDVWLVDHPSAVQTNVGELRFFPYMPPGELIKHLDSAGILNAPRAVFCHQEFFGAPLGALESTVGDIWPPEAPLAVSGHIHEHLQLRPNVLYVGIPYDQAYGDQARKTVSVLEFTPDSWTERREELNMPRRLVVDTTVEDASKKLKFEDKTDWLAVRLNIRDLSEEISKFKKTKRYEELAKKAQVICHSTDTLVMRDGPKDRPGFASLLKDAVKSESDMVKWALEEVTKRARSSQKLQATS